MNASVTTRACLAAAAAIASTSSTVSASGFSQSTCFPAAQARIVQSAWRPFGNGL